MSSTAADLRLVVDAAKALEGSKTAAQLVEPLENAARAVEAGGPALAGHARRLVHAAANAAMADPRTNELGLQLLAVVAGMPASAQPADPAPAAPAFTDWDTYQAAPLAIREAWAKAHPQQLKTLADQAMKPRRY
ncbi:MAG: hypothetical protein GX442_14590 [Candidatus Riflebacteria bacterium]|nr:hypothetical protein [Candidatus Riflebacteria bacterium]